MIKYPGKIFEKQSQITILLLLALPTGCMREEIPKCQYVRQNRPPLFVVFRDTGVSRSDLWQQQVFTALKCHAISSMLRTDITKQWTLLVNLYQPDKAIRVVADLLMPDGKIRYRYSGKPFFLNEWNTQPYIRRQNAEDLARGIALALQGVAADEMMQKKDSLKHRKAHITVIGSDKLPVPLGRLLMQAFRRVYDGPYDDIIEDKKGADFFVYVRLSYVKENKESSESDFALEWKISTADKHEVGQVSQLRRFDKEIGYTTQNLLELAEQAASGIKQAISNFTGREVVPLPSWQGSRKI